MSTTISTHQNHHLPLIASLAVVGVIAAAGVVSVVANDATSSGTNDQAPALTPPGSADYQQYGHYYRGQGIGTGGFHSTTSGGKVMTGP